LHNPESLSQNGGRENDNDTGIYFSEKQVYEAKGIRPDSEEEWAGEVMECDSDVEAIDLRDASLRVVHRHQALSVAISTPRRAPLYRRSQNCGGKLYHELLKSPPQSASGH
jgi:hypothetical protein